MRSTTAAQLAFRGTPTDFGVRTGSTTPVWNARPPLGTSFLPGPRPLSISPRFKFSDSQRAMCKAATLTRRPLLASFPSGPRSPQFPRSHARNSDALLPRSFYLGALLTAPYIPPHPAKRVLLQIHFCPQHSALSIALPLPTAARVRVLRSPRDHPSLIPYKLYLSTHDARDAVVLVGDWV